MRLELQDFRQEFQGLHSLSEIEMEKFMRVFCELAKDTDWNLYPSRKDMVRKIEEMISVIARVVKGV